jgi:predicted transcriptional regulator
MSPLSKKQNGDDENSAILAAIKRAEKAADQGRLITHEEVKKRFITWTKTQS